MASCSNEETQRLRSFSRIAKDQGYEGVDLFEKIATRTVLIKESQRKNRCVRCWHDKITRCICSYIPPISEANVKLPIKVLVLMHYKEYFSAGNDAKLILALLPGCEGAKEAFRRSQLYIFGKKGDWENFEVECSLDPDHTLLLWPAEKALTIEGFLSKLPKDSPWRQRAEATRINSDDTETKIETKCDDSELPTLRVVVLDGVYSQARSMFKTIKKRFSATGIPIPPHVALHPKTLSVYHRAQKSYAQSSAVTVRNSSDPDALHICSVEAFALLLKELGEPEPTTRALVKAVEINNRALVHDLQVRPPTPSLMTAEDQE